MRAASALLLAVAALVASGCKQGEGERCQIDDDCGGGLICNQAQQQCTAPGQSGGIDATVPLPMDAPMPIDAAIDAAPDATIDAP